MPREVDIRDLPKMFEKALYNTLFRVANRVRSRAKTIYAPEVTGNLRRSILAPEVTAPGQRPMKATIPIQATYAEALHEGSKPHMITAKNARALYWEGAAHPVKSVMHPGYKGNPYVEKALNDVVENSLDDLFFDGFYSVFGQ